MLGYAGARHAEDPELARGGSSQVVGAKVGSMFEGAGNGSMGADAGGGGGGNGDTMRTYAEALMMVVDESWWLLLSRRW